MGFIRGAAAAVGLLLGGGVDGVGHIMGCERGAGSATLHTKQKDVYVSFFFSIHTNTHCPTKKNALPVPPWEETVSPFHQVSQSQSLLVKQIEYVEATSVASLRC